MGGPSRLIRNRKRTHFSPPEAPDGGKQARQGLRCVILLRDYCSVGGQPPAGYHVSDFLSSSLLWGCRGAIVTANPGREELGRGSRIGRQVESSRPDPVRRCRHVAEPLVPRSLKTYMPELSLRRCSGGPRRAWPESSRQEHNWAPSCRCPGSSLPRAGRCRASLAPAAAPAAASPD